MKIETYKVDAFTEKLFAGNPAAVCILKDWISDELMQNIAAENNLSETAFVVPEKHSYQIRWFTPTVEVDLCGHATLASAFILFEFFEKDKDSIDFYSPRSGELKVFKEGGKLFLDFPMDTLVMDKNFEEIEKAIGSIPLEIYKGKADYIAVLKGQKDIEKLEPNLPEISKLKARGLIVTARGEAVDFVSRFFGPQSGVDEDPVTGSAHTSLIPLWSKKLGKDALTAAQLSKRGGALECRNKGERCFIGGNVTLFLKGEIYTENEK